MELPDVKREGESPKRRATHEERHLPYRTENDKHGPRILSHVAVNMPRESRQPSIPKNSTRRDVRSMHGEIAETPEISITRRPAEPSDNAISQRLPVRTTKLVPSIEVAEPPSSPSSESEGASDSEYDDEQWRHPLAETSPAPKPAAAAPASNPAPRVQASKPTKSLAPKATLPALASASTKKSLAPKPTSTALASASTTKSSAPKPATNALGAGPFTIVPAPKATTTTSRPKPTIAGPTSKKSTMTAPISQPGATAQASKASTEAAAPRPAPSQPAPSQPAPPLAAIHQPEMGPPQLRDDPDAWMSERVLKRKRYTKKDMREFQEQLRRLRWGTADPNRGSLEEAIEALVEHHQNIASAGNATGLGSAALSPPSEHIDVVAPGPVGNPGESPTEDMSLCVSIEREQTPYAVDEAPEGMPRVVDRQDGASAQTATVIGNMVSEEVAALRSELQSLMGQVCEFKKTLGVDKGHLVAFGEGPQEAGPAPDTIEEGDHSVDDPAEERPRKRTKKGKHGKGKKTLAQEEVRVPPEASNFESTEASNAAMRQEVRRALGMVEDQDTTSKAKPAGEHFAAPLASAQRTGIQPFGIGPEASRAVNPRVINNHPGSMKAAEGQTPLKAQQAPVAGVSATGADRAALGGTSGKGRSAWKTGVNSIPLGPRQPKQEPPRRRILHDRFNLPYDRREVYMPDVLPRCVCSLLHFYFESGLNQRPDLEAFPGTRQEFFANVEQIAHCRGHEKEMIIFCEGLWASEKANRNTLSQNYRFPTGMNVHLRFPDDISFPSSDGPSPTRSVTLPPEYGTHVKDECLDRSRRGRVRPQHPSTIPPHLFYGTAAPGANGPGKRKGPPS